MTTTSVPLQVAPEATSVTYSQRPGEVRSSLNFKVLLVTGYTQIVLSILSLAFGVASICLEHQGSKIAISIWGALAFYLVAGILGVVAGKSKGRNLCANIGFLVMSTLAIVIAVVHAVIGGIISAHYSLYSSEYYYYFDLKKSYNAVNIVCTMIGGVEVIVAMFASVYMCCTGACCCETSTTIQYASYVVETGQVDVQENPVGQHYFGQPHVIGQPQFNSQPPYMGQHHVMYQPQQKGQYMGQAQAQLRQQNSQYMGHAGEQLPQQKNLYMGQAQAHLPQRKGLYMGQAQAHLPQQKGQYMGQAQAQLPQQNSQYMGQARLPAYSEHSVKEAQV